ncbi:MAG: DUF3305 domain-containing protein [Gammaproteobacteria bacterium]|nr:DUF3305 domain-containing protein [Gammaproteobacteria bacterium]
MSIHQRRPQRRYKGFIMQDSLAAALSSTCPVAVLVEYQLVHDNRWIDGRWVVTGVVASKQPVEEGLQRKLIHSGDEAQQYLWTGLRIELHKDDAESFYCNLMSDNPSVFVICDEQQDAPLQPSIVTLSYSEATTYMETDQRVERVEMPAELYRWLEQYVLANYVPEKKKKRKRVDWKESDRGRH